MVEEATKLGDLLKLPNLEEETKTLINAKMRELIGDVKPIAPEIKQEVQSIMNEYLNGATQGGE
ncbi:MULTISPECIES: hypothetical protein [Paenibacillus]|uniref:Uncharacterized protein n=1 Tax=Paenibacillus odorifer TaxID=189426 RepID=A0ABX3HYK9_9BACL|nr:hypothetical protein [Paenibacillus odorifer]OMD55266.1 hypothetical protein BSK51_04225 [Paenibacillus odorifer]